MDSSGSGGNKNNSSGSIRTSFEEVDLDREKRPSVEMSEVGRRSSGGVLGDDGKPNEEKSRPLLESSEGLDVERGASSPATSSPDADETAEGMRYSANSFVTLVGPVLTTMLLASWAVVYVDDGANGGLGQQGLASLPVVYKETGTGSTGEQLGHAIINALVIVGIVIGMTTVLVTLYYFKCMKIIIGWLLLSTSVLLGLSSQFMVQIGLDVYQITTDYPTYVWFFWNFAVTGTFAIFYEGIFNVRAAPLYVTQTYLVLVSVTMAWLLLRFLPQWTSWSLLVMLAFYDLCAVLTPCGPLKFLVEMAQERDDPLPGLLFEAQVRRDEDDEGKVDTPPPPPPPKPAHMKADSDAPARTSGHYVSLNEQNRSDDENDEVIEVVDVEAAARGPTIARMEDGSENDNDANDADVQRRSALDHIRRPMRNSIATLISPTRSQTCRRSWRGMPSATEASAGARCCMQN